MIRAQHANGRRSSVPSELSISLILGCSVALTACGDREALSPAARQVPLADLLDGDITVELNPSGLTPLAAEASFQTKMPVSVAIEVVGAEPLRHEVPGRSTRHVVPILGLYAGTENTVILRLSNGDASYALDTVTLSTDPVPEFFPTVEIVAADRSRMESGWTLSNLGIGEEGRLSSWPTIFDTDGAIRWYMNLSFLDDFAFPVKRARNGNLLLAQGFVVFEYDMLGWLRGRWDTPGYFLHHELLEKPNGNLVVAVEVLGRATLEDHVLEIDRGSGTIVNEWDARQVLDVYRRTFVDDDSDWFHMNAIYHSEPDDALIISGRNQSAVVKVTNNNELVWILAAKKGWGLAGLDSNGHNTSDFLLTAVDATGTPYSEPVQLGDEDAPDFAWPWGQHAAMILPNGNLFLFDNGVTRNFDEDEAPFSRGVEYEIDETAMTVRQVWQYGQNRGPDYHSPIISDVDLLPSTGNRLIMPGIVRGSDPHAYVTEVGYPNGDVIFEAVIHFKNLRSSGTFSWGGFDLIYRSERLSLYPR